MSDTKLIKSGWKHAFRSDGKQYYVHEKWPYISSYKQAMDKEKEWKLYNKNVGGK